MPALAHSLNPSPLIVDAADAEARLADLIAQASSDGLDALADTTREDGPVRSMLLGIAGGSPFLWDLCRRDPGRLWRLLAQAPDAALDAALQRAQAACDSAESQADAMQALRGLKQEAALLIALCDLGGVWDLEKVTGALTRVADAAVTSALSFLFGEAERAGRFLPGEAGPDRLSGCGYVAIAMGKHGAFELNYSSDIDLVILYDPNTRRLPATVEPGPFFVRLTQALVRMLSERTGDGYVFRVDLRLRPDPGSTAVAIALPAAFAYYETAGQNWERAAMIKARACAGDIALGESFLAELRPFIWRRHLDYAAIADIHAMKRQIHLHKGHQSIAVAGHDLKLGRGGIREIEFFVQTQQLIAGGRNAELRGRATVAMLDALCEANWISTAARDDMRAAYAFLRGLEHRLQMVADEQTHAIPAEDEALARFARFAGHTDRAALEKAVTEVLTMVQGHYAGLFETEPDLASAVGSLVFTGTGDDPETLETLARLGYAKPVSAAATVRGWHFGRYVAMRSPRAREDLTALTPALLEALARDGRGDETLQAFDRMLSHMPAGFQFFSILRANVGLLQMFARILATAPRLADIVAARPHALDGLLDPALANLPTDPAAMRARLDQTLRLARGYEDALDRARVFVREQIFQTGARIIAGDTPAHNAGVHFSALAEATIGAMLAAVTDELQARHGVVPSARIVVLGMGKLGSREMTAASDLDLIVLYDHPETVSESTGERPIAPATWFARLTHRLIAALTAPTAEGSLYAVDMRLRPSGRQGPVAIRLASFRDYQIGEAWTWEHMALTRARAVAGDPTFRAEVTELIGTVLRRPRDRAKTLADIREMRALIAKEKGEANPWDLKLAAGGLLDIEFAAQALQLIHAADHPEALETSTAGAIARMRRHGLLGAAETETLLQAHALYTAVTQILRLCISEDFDPSAASPVLKALAAHAAGLPDFGRLEATLRATRHEVRSVVATILA